MNSVLTPCTTSARQYGVYRALFGLYLTVHFAYLLPYCVELFSSAGMLPDAALSPLFAISPSAFKLSDAPTAVLALTASALAAAVAFTFGRLQGLAAPWMLFVLISLFARNPLIANPALPYVGFMLLLHLFVPATPRAHTALSGTRVGLPHHLFLAASVVLALSYSYSGYTKLLSPGWMSGDTVAYVLDNPLARDWWVRDRVLSMPAPVLSALTWFILYVELAFAPLYLVRRLRFALWGGMLFVQFGFLLLLRFPDLTIPMLLFHLLTFDPAWLRARPVTGGVLHYDGECGVCHAAVRFALDEARGELRFRPMQRDGATADVKTWRLEGDGRVFEKSDAVLRLLSASGGQWRALALAGRCIPRPLRDGVYDGLARVRRRLRTQPPALCPIVPAELRGRFL